jgi:hypothetical protein
VTPVVALVVAHRGGAALARTLASVDWMARHYVVDPGGVLSPGAWPPNAGHWAAPASSGWVLLLSEGEIVSEGFAAALETIEGTGAAAYRLAVECRAFGGVIRLRSRPVRLRRLAPYEIRVTLGGELAFAGGGRSPVLAAAAVARHLPPLPGDAVDVLNAEASMLAALAAARGVRPRFGRLIASGAAGAARVLFGAGCGRLGWGRWIAAVLAGYRALLAEAKLWERVQLGAPPPA